MPTPTAVPVEMPIRYVTRWVTDAGTADEELDPASFEYGQSFKKALKDALAHGEKMSAKSTMEWYEVYETEWSQSAYEGIGGWVDTGRRWVGGAEAHDQ